MSNRGLLVDMAAQDRLKHKLECELDECDAYIYKRTTEVGFSYTNTFPNSHMQVAALLFNHLGLRGGKLTPGKKRFSADQDSLNSALRQIRVRDQEHIPLLHALFHRIRLNTVLSRYLSFVVDDDGRLRAVVKPLHAKTLRYAYENPPLQQFPEETRHIFVAGEGNVILSADYAQLEARILAYLSGDHPSIGVFETGGDVHAQNTRDLFGWSEAEWDNLDPEIRAAHRNYGKPFLYRLCYGGTAASGDKKLACPCDRWGCSERLPDIVSLKKADAVITERRWMQKHPAVEKWQAGIASFVRKHHYYALPLGGKRWISKPWGRDLERELKNVPMQTTSSQIMSRAQVQLENAGVPIMMQWHDSFISEIKITDINRVAKLKKHIMEQYIAELGCSFPVDVTVGQNLGKYHPKRNPQGQRKWQESTS